MITIVAMARLLKHFLDGLLVLELTLTDQDKYNPNLILAIIMLGLETSNIEIASLSNR